MAIVDLVMPKMGESIMEATILKWLKQPGEYIKQDETLLEIATDKVDSEVPSTAEGTLEEVLFKVNDVVPIGSVIARIRTGAEHVETASPVTAPAASRPVAATPQLEHTPVVSSSNGNGYGGFQTMQKPSATIIDVTETSVQEGK